MSALASLARAYDRLPDAPAFGYSMEKIGFLISLNVDGSPAGQPIDLREGEGKKKTGRLVLVPQPAKRTSGVAPNYLWDKTSYALGVTAGEGRRTAAEHQAFVQMHRKLAGTNPTTACRLSFVSRILVAWTIFRAARLARRNEGSEHRLRAGEASGCETFASTTAPRRGRCGRGSALKATRWRPPASSPASVVRSPDCTQQSKACGARRRREHRSFPSIWTHSRLTATSKARTLRFRRRLPSHTQRRSTASWKRAAAIASRSATPRQSSGRTPPTPRRARKRKVFLPLCSAQTRSTKASKRKRSRPFFSRVREGRPIADFKPDLPQGVRFFVLGLAPNAARLSVRFYLEDDFGAIAERFLAHVARMRIEPPPKDERPSIWRLLIETAAQRKSENVPPKSRRRVAAGDPYAAPPIL